MRPLIITITVILFFAGFFFHLYEAAAGRGGYDLRITNRRYYYSGIGLNYRGKFEVWRLSGDGRGGRSALMVFP